MKTKVSILGAGNIGGSLAHLIVQAELGDVVLLDIEEGVAKGKALDISQAAPLWISAGLARRYMFCPAPPRAADRLGEHRRQLRARGRGA